MKTFRFAPVLIVLTLISCGGKENAPIEYKTPAEVLVAMKAQYEGSWYESLTFIQTTIQHSADGSTDTTTWFEAMELPGKLRIDIGEPNSGNTWIFRNDSIYVFNQGTLTVGRPTFHPLLLLGFDAYFLDSASLINKLDSLGFDLDLLSDTTWQGREVYVVGAEAGDTEAQQFWIDKERLYFVRLLQSAGPDASSQQDVQFNSYEEIGGGWVAPEVIFYVDGNLQMEEYYRDMSDRVEFDARFFNPTLWASADHWYSP
ncbi:MAG: hypothetical protein BMS9Abin05_1214 [Rhodothermia bacterium]|nr:MAG: hypothetical protein BMS9Abin05_1214 [Rhodothermia bacterium]